MPIYDFSTRQEDEYPQEDLSPIPQEISPKKKGQLFSQVAARLFFLLLLVADIIWMAYALVSLVVSVVGRFVTAGKISQLQGWQGRKWVSLRRSVVCAMALVIALFSPSFGMMVACTYFIMYDKKGIDEVFPSSLQSQFKEFMPGTLSK
ncbi:MAG: hypothetical protein RLZZ453_403 [Chlamydiota bacterium]|jgi:hypothetical protein